MVGTEHAKLFKTGQYGKLYITSGSHARGNTLRIQVLPEGEKAVANGSQNTCLNKDAVEVYGVISGNLGWNEVYGWLHEGRWQDDFYKLVAEEEAKIETKKLEQQESLRISAEKDKERREELLKNY